MKKWFIFRADISLGPYSLEEVKKLVDSGKVSLDVKVREETSLEWHDIKDVAELFNYLHNPKDDISQQKQQNTLSKAKCVIDSDGSCLRLECPYCRQHYKVDLNVQENSVFDCQTCGSSFAIETPFSKHASTLETVFDSKSLNVNLGSEIIEGNIICPHCWKTFSPEDVLYISKHPNLINDEVAGEFEQKRFMPAVYHSSGLPLDEMGEICTDMACPHCHLRIPGSVIDLESNYISIVGAPSSGKSYYLTALIHQLRKSMPEYCASSFFDVDPVLNAVINRYENLIFMSAEHNKIVALPKTQQTGNDFSNQVLLNDVSMDLPNPFIFQMQKLSATNNNCNFSKNIIFYDNAGEHFQPGADTISNPATLHLIHSNAIIFIFDPINDAAMRHCCNDNDPQLASGAKVTNQAILFAEMISRIKRHANMTTRQKCNIPLIIVAGKYDVWQDVMDKKLKSINPFDIDEQSLELTLNIDTIYDISFATRELLNRYSPALVAQAESFFEDVTFVPSSSFGTFASKNEMGTVGIFLDDLNPIWVDVPFYLMLKKWGELKTSHIKNVNLESDFVAKVVDDQIVFKHPVSGKKVSLPSNYQGKTLDIAGKFYRLPELNKAAANGKKKNVW